MWGAHKQQVKWCQPETETTPSISPEITNSAFGARASRLLKSQIISERYMDTWPQMLRNVSVQHGQLIISGPFIQILRREPDWLSLVLAGFLPFGSWRRNALQTGQPTESRGKNFTGEDDVWQGLVSLMIFITCNTLKMWKCMDRREPESWDLPELNQVCLVSQNQQQLGLSQRSFLDQYS